MNTPSTPPPEAPLPWASGGYSIKRHGVSLTNCDSEPVQTPGCIQAHGALLVLRMSDLVILQVSENARDFLGAAPDALLGKSIGDVVSADGARRLHDFLGKEPIDRNPLYVFTQPIADAAVPLDFFVHTIEGVVLLECEPASRDTPDYYALVKKSVARMQAAPTVAEFCRAATEEIRSFTGLDRVMIYRFHADFHGEVVGESKRDDMETWLGFHYPAADIPQPAREIFKKIWVRPLPNAAGPLVEMVPLTNPDTGRPVMMTHCALRGASVMDTEYLQNMGVAASLTLSILCDGELWGLIACHHLTPTHFPYQVRAACEFMAQVVSLQLRGAEQREALAYRLRMEEIHNRLIAQAALDAGLSSLTTASPNLLAAIDAGGAAVFHSDRWWRVGETPADAPLDELKDWLAQRSEFRSSTRPAYVTDALARDFPGGAALAEVASGPVHRAKARRATSRQRLGRVYSRHRQHVLFHPCGRPT